MNHLTRQYLQRFIDDAHYKPMMGEIMFRSQWATFKQVFFLGDTTTVRALLMVASVWQGVAFIPAFGMLKRPFYAEMRFASGWYWAAAFMLHASLVWWRFRDHANRPAIGLAVNFYGFLLWTFMCTLESMQSHGFSASMGMEWTVIVAAFGALIRTGDKRDRTSA